MDLAVLLLRLTRSASPSLFTTGWVGIVWIGNGLAGFSIIRSGRFGGFFLAATTANQVGRHRERCGHCNNVFFHFL